MRLPAFERTHEVILFDLASITFEKLKRLVEKVFLTDEAYHHGGNIHIADRKAVGEIQRFYVKRCTGDTSEVIEVHEGNIKAVVKLLGTSVSFRELCVEFAERIKMNARHAEEAKGISDEKETERKREEGSLIQATKVDEASAERAEACWICKSFNVRLAMEPPFPKDEWDERLVRSGEDELKSVLTIMVDSSEHWLVQVDGNEYKLSPPHGVSNYSPVQ